MAKTATRRARARVPTPAEDAAGVVGAEDFGAEAGVLEAGTLGTADTAETLAAARTVASQRRRGEAAVHAKRKEVATLEGQEIEVIALDTFVIGEPLTADEIETAKRLPPGRRAPAPRTRQVQPGEPVSMTIGEAIRLEDAGSVARPDTERGRAAIMRLGAVGNAALEAVERRHKRVKEYAESAGVTAA